MATIIPMSKKNFFFDIEVDGFTLPLNKIKIQYKSLKLKN